MPRTPGLNLGAICNLLGGLNHDASASACDRRCAARPGEDSDSDRPSPKPKPDNNNDDRRPSLAESVTSVVSDAFDASARIMVELGTGKRTTAKRRGSTSSVESVRTWRKSGKSKQQKNEPWARFIINEFHACLLGTDMRLLVAKHVLKEFRVLYDKEDCCATLRAVKFA